MSAIKVACVQMVTGTEPDKNEQDAVRLIRDAASQGAKFVATPEMTGAMDIRPGGSRRYAVPESETQILSTLSELAHELDIWLLIGSLAVTLPDDARLANRSFLISPEGKIIARYDKIHMFDVNVEDGQSYRESKTYKPGTKLVTSALPFGTLGLTICFDLRFPDLYRQLAKSGANILTCPAAFTRVTGRAHWHALLRARAIENAAFVIAPAQAGKHEDGRETFGHSLIISPWGEILAEGPAEGEDVICAEIDITASEKARAQIPSLSLDMDFS